MLHYLLCKYMIELMGEAIVWASMAAANLYIHS